MIISENEVEEMFSHSNFGKGANHKRILEQGVLKTLASYHSGSTLNAIMINANLITKDFELTNKGKMFLYETFKERC